MRKTITQTQIENIIRLYQEGLGSDTIAPKFGIHPNTVLKILKKNGIARRPLSAFTPEDVEKMRLMYADNKSLETIGKEFGITHGGVRQIFVKNNIERRNADDCHRKYEINEDFFDTIDTEEKAYFLGFLYADGCNNMNHMWSISLELKDTDKEILDKLSSLIHIDPIVAKKQVKTYDRIKNGKGVFSKLSINSKHMCLTLNSFGLTPNKSLTLKYPEQLSDNLHKHFIRGYFDGDGSISNEENKVSDCGMLSTNEFCKYIKQLIEKYKISSSIHQHWIYKSSEDEEKKKTNVYRISLSGNRNIEKFLHWIYDDATIYLDRKYQRYLKFLKKMEEVNAKIVAGTQGYPQARLRESNPELFLIK